MNSTTVANRLKKYAHAPWEPAWPAAAEAPTSETGAVGRSGARLENIVVIEVRTPCGPNTGRARRPPATVVSQTCPPACARATSGGSFTPDSSIPTR